MKKSMIFLAVVLLTAAGCAQRSDLPGITAADSLACVQDNLAHRASMNEFFLHDPGSPFLRDTSAVYTGITWYPVDVRYRATARLHRYPSPDTIRIMGTKGEPRKQLRYGFFELVLPDENGTPVTVHLNVYKFTPSDSVRYARYRKYLSMWFTDRTTGTETYHVGRYIELGEEQADPDAPYIIDLNKAFNPYCAYSALYSCAIPSDEDRLPIALRVGERKYHE
jgi:uncharacterized protein (DUF1684 family)